MSQFIRFRYISKVVEWIKNKWQWEGNRKPARGHLRVFKMVVRTGFEPVNSNAERIYSPRPLASWIPYLFKNLNFEATNIHI